MTPKQAQKRARRLKVGAVVEVLWIDSGRNASDPDCPLICGRLYGRVEKLDLKADELTVAYDFSETRGGERASKSDAGSESYGTVWIPAVLECWRLERR